MRYARKRGSKRRTYRKRSYKRAGHSSGYKRRTFRHHGFNKHRKFGKRMSGYVKVFCPSVERHLAVPRNEAKWCFKKARMMALAYMAQHKGRHHEHTNHEITPKEFKMMRYRQMAELVERQAYKATWLRAKHAEVALLNHLCKGKGTMPLESTYMGGDSLGAASSSDEHTSKKRNFIDTAIGEGEHLMEGIADKGIHAIGSFLTGML